MTQEIYKDLGRNGVMFYDGYDKKWYTLTPEEIKETANSVQGHVDYRYWPIFKFLIDQYRTENSW